MTLDPLSDFEHDHERTNRLVFAVRDLVATIELSSGQASQSRDSRAPAQLKACLLELRDGLLDHFAREEEGLFPFIVERLPDLAEAVARLQSAHDTICGTLLRMSSLADVGAQNLLERSSQLRVLFNRFEAAYATHAREECEVLQALSARFGDADRAALASLIEGL